MPRLLPALLCLLALPWVAPAVSPSSAPAVLPALGPPAICFPLEVTGRTLPWGDGPMEAAPRYSLQQLQADLLPLLNSEDTLTRMENLRRSAILLSPLHRAASTEERTRQRERLLSVLRARVVAAQIDGASAKQLAPLIFDLGYLQAALAQIMSPAAAAPLSHDYGDGAAALRYAGKHAPQNGAVQLGLALGLFDLRQAKVDREAFLRCAALVGKDATLRANLSATAKHFLTRDDYDALVTVLDR